MRTPRFATPTFREAACCASMAWRDFSAQRTDADYQAWRDQRDWTERKYAMWEAIERGWLWKHESGTYVKFTQAGADPFA
jgi:hypothetical protein